MTTNKKKVFIFLGLIILTSCVLFSLWQLKPASTSVTPDSEPTSTSQPQPIPISTLPAGQVANGPLPTLAPSLSGTKVDCPLKVDAQGQLALTVGIRTCFDYFLSSLGEKTEPQLISDIRLYLTSTLPNTASPYAEKLLDQYIAYRHAAQDRAPNKASNNSLDSSNNLQRTVIQTRSALRHQFFTPTESAVFFGNEEAYDDFSIQQMQINSDASLKPEQKAVKIMGILNQLPPDVADSIRPLMQNSELQQLSKDIKSNGGSLGELHQIRETLVGDTVTSHLEQMDASNANWQQQITAYLAARDQLLAGSNAANQQDAITALRNQTFSTPEDRTRAQAYESMHDSGMQPPQ